jgi:hypothetical protein
MATETARNQNTGRLSKAGKNAGATDYVSSVSYAPHGAASSMNLHNGVEETTDYNSRLQPSLMEATQTGSLWKLEDFYCDAEASPCTSNNGNVIWQRLTAPKTNGTLVLGTSYVYDAVNRLTSATENGSPGWAQTYTYGGQFGNLLVSGDGDSICAGTQDYGERDVSRVGAFPISGTAPRTAIQWPTGTTECS